MKHAAALLVTLGIGAILFYASRFWFLSLWDRPGLFGWAELPPGGGVLGRWLRGTDAAPFELLIWAVAVFVILSALHALWATIRSGKD